jgi:hypothetical protein
MNAPAVERNSAYEEDQIMNAMPVYCARAALAIVAATACGCASEPALTGKLLVEGFISGTSEVAIVTGRTLTNALGVGIQAGPPLPSPVPAPPAFLR